MVFFSLALLCIVTQTLGSGFLKGSSVPRASADAFQAALDAALGCGSEVRPEHLAAIEASLLPTWRVLPKTTRGHIDWRSLRYLAHRYFMKASSLRVRGFEPSVSETDTHVGMSNMIHEHIPSFSHRFSDAHDYSLESSVTFIVAIEQMMFHAEVYLLERVFHLLGLSTRGVLNTDQVGEVLDTYIFQWIVGSDAGAHTSRSLGPDLLQDVIPGFAEIATLLRGELRTLDFSRWRTPRRQRGDVLLSKGYSFSDVHEVVGAITRSFAEFSQEDCKTMRDTLFELDTHRTGRVPLSKFYHKGVGSEWRFGESEDYLRALGALDESSVWQQKQVIIPNYMQGASNCVVATQHYQLCCQDVCEGILAELEVAVGEAEASPRTILQLVRSMTNVGLADFDDEDTSLVKVDSGLEARLEDVAALHGGTVLLHGRLFAQWLHHVFPHQCPYPHKAGTTISASANEFNGSYAEEHEMITHSLASLQNVSTNEQVSESMQWMLQWSDEEELLGESVHRRRDPLLWYCLLLVGVALAILGSLFSGSSSSMQSNSFGPLCQSDVFRTHSV